MHMQLNEIMSEPAVYVRYDGDGEKAICPLSFVQGYENDPEGIRKKGSDAYFYVFWSNDDNDSPSEMAKRVSEIPRIERGNNNAPGYYRANILKIAGKL